MAAVAGGVFGAVSVAAGARVLAGLDIPGYVVLPWLVRYNVAAGAAGAIVAVGLWHGAAWARRGAAVLAVAHAMVLLALIAARAAGGSVATDSLGAMALRTAVWTGIALTARMAGRRRA